jgi:signal transduction histidine kinase
VENRPYTPDEATPKSLSLYLDSEIQQELASHPVLSHFSTATINEAQLILMKKNNRLWVTFPDGEYCDYPFYKKNILTILSGFRSDSGEERNETPFENITRTTQTLEKKIFSSVSLSPENNIKDFWDEILKKVNALSVESHSLSDLVKNLLDVPFLQNFHSALIILHLKGQTKAELLGTLWRSEKAKDLVEVKEFNSFFNSIKKSKIKSFSTDDFPKLNLPFNGSFLAKELVSKKYSLVALASRHDFLDYSKEEIELFETCIGLLQPHFERLVDQEFSDKRISELRICLKDFPLPLRVIDSNTGSSFQNDLYAPELQEKDIFFNKKVMGPFSLDLYDSDELRHYAFDLFHFQRISLLGELLNTLRHELSNPLFGLKLSSQIFNTLDVNQDSKEIMTEIEKNVNRCQLIMENFSNLYQVQHENTQVALKRMIDESLVLSKSEAREMRKSINYQEGTESLKLDVPLIFVVQILFNLIVNSAQALKQGGMGGELSIEVEKTEKEVAIHLKDNGPGIPADKLSMLFKPFFTTKTQGTGLGLVLSRNLAVKMGGNLEYLVNNNHKGAHFRLTLPLS